MHINFYRFHCAGYEDIYHDANAGEALQRVLDKWNYRRVFIICSRTLNTKTEVIRGLEKALGDKCVGLTDKIGEHAPIENVLAAARAARDANADVILSVGGGSVIDLGRVMQICLSEGIYDKATLLKHEAGVKPDYSDLVYSTTRIPSIRQIVIPTTMATAEWTSGATPVDEDTHLKARFHARHGAAQAIIYDPDIVAQTPPSLLLSTAVRGLDHAINTRCALQPNPLASVLAEQAIVRFIQYLPRIKRNPHDREAMHNCQLAVSCCGMAQMSAIHGFSHYMVHIVGPYASVGHSNAACVLMLAQAKWLEQYAGEQHGAIKRLLGRESEPFHAILEDLLNTLEMPTRFKDLDISGEQLDEMAPFALDHPFATRYNLKPLTTTEEVRAVLALAE